LWLHLILQVCIVVEINSRSYVNTLCNRTVYIVYRLVNIIYLSRDISCNHYHILCIIFTDNSVLWYRPILRRVLLGFTQTIPWPKKVL